MKKLLVIGLVLLVTGCMSDFKIKDAGRASNMWGAYSVTSMEQLNENVSSNVIIWTKYGPILEAIHFWKPVADGDPLPILSNESNEKRQKFRSDMAVSEIVELYRTEVGGKDQVVISMGAPEAIQVNGKEGYRIESLLSSTRGYDYKVDLFFMVSGGTLYMIELRSAEVHYFDERQKAFNNIIKSVRL